MPDVAERLEKDVDSMIIDELLHLTDLQFDEVMKQLMLELRVEPRKTRNKPTYYFAETVSLRDQNREILFVNKGTSIVGMVDVEKLWTYAEKVRAPRSILMTLGDVSRDAEKEARKRSVQLFSGKDLVALIRKSNLEDMILKDFALGRAPPAPPTEDTSPEGQKMRGIELMESGDLVKALEHFDRAIAADPKSEMAWRLKGEVLDQLGHHDKALECYARALEINDESPELWYYIGSSMYSLGNHDEELQAYDKALLFDPKLEKVWMSKGSTLLKTHRYGEALGSFDKLIKLNPKNVAAHSNRGIALKHLNELDEALGAFDSAIRLDQEFAEAWANKGSVLIQLGRFEDALGCYKQLVGLRSDSAQAWKSKGELESRLGHINDSIASLEKVLEIEPTNADAKKLLDFEKSKIHADQKGLHSSITLIFGAPPKVKPEAVAWEEPKIEAPKPVGEVIEVKAAAEVEQAAPLAAKAEPVEAEPAAELPVIPEEGLMLEPEEIGEPLVGVAEEVFGDAAELMLLMKRPELALQEIDKGLRLEPLSVRMMLLKGMAQFGGGNVDEALRSFIRATELDPGCEEAIYSIEFILSSRGQYQEAEEALASLLNSKRWIPEILAAMDSFAAEKMKEVEEHMESAISLVPSAMAWNYKGLLDLEEGDFEKAIEAFQRARELEHVFSDPSNNTGVAYAKLGKSDEASDFYDLAISAQPRNAVAWSNRGVLLTNLDRYKEALACFDQSLLLENNALVQINKGFAHLEEDSLDDAFKAFDASLTLKETPEGYNDKGIALVRMNQINDAVASFRAALHIAPAFQDAKKNLEQYEKLETPAPKKHKAKEPELPLPPASTEEAWKDVEDLDEGDLGKMKKGELAEILNSLGLSSAGTKKELADRIVAAKAARKLK